MSARDELAKLLFVTDNDAAPDPGHEWEMTTRHNPAYAEYAFALSDAILAAGYRKARTITTAEEANDLPDRSAILTPGQIIFRKWEDYYGDGKHAWERELGQVVPAELLSDDGHFPATVLHEPEASK